MSDEAISKFRQDLGYLLEQFKGDQELTSCHIYGDSGVQHLERYHSGKHFPTIPNLIALCDALKLKGTLTLTHGDRLIQVISLYEITPQFFRNVFGSSLPTQFFNRVY